MANPRYKPLTIGAITIVLVWVLAYTGYRIAQGSKMTPEKVTAALRATDLSKLSEAERLRRIRELADKFNRLGQDDRRRARRDPAWDPLWRQMTEQEKAEYIDRTMPTGFKQMISAFEQMPEDKRRAAVTNTLARLRSQETDMPTREDPNRPPMSEELQKKVITTGLKTFYAESSAETKAEMAPVLEEMQRLMESGRLFRR